MIIDGNGSSINDNLNIHIKFNFYYFQYLDFLYELLYRLDYWNDWYVVLYNPSPQAIERYFANFRFFHFPVRTVFLTY
ncbi:hypothetical protein BGP_1092 [Beggiatoa sp. PS]|nr:hypothetical protein BGP_1092 [Beggiatoa sp. PS]